MSAVPVCPEPLQRAYHCTCNNYFRCDIDKIKNVQRRFTKAIFPQMTYSARLSKLKLQTLEMRRIIADLTMCYKLLNGLTETDYISALLPSSISQTRGNSLKLNKNHLASTRDGALFHNRIINLWNALPGYIVTARSVSCFKQYLLKHVINVGFYFLPLVIIRLACVFWFYVFYRLSFYGQT